VVHDLVADVRAPLVHLEDDLGIDAVRPEVVRGAARRDQREAESLEIAGDLHHRGLVVIVDADEGGPLGGQYRAQYRILGPCPFHLTMFDLTKHGMVAAGQATESLPQIVLEVSGDDIWAKGVMGLIFGYHANLAARA